MSPLRAVASNLSAWVKASHFTYVWRCRNSTLKAYTCHLVVLPRLRDVSTLPWGIYDHVLHRLQLTTSTAHADGLWRLSCFGLSDPRVDTSYWRDLTDYWAHTAGSASPAATCDAFKTFMRGSFQTTIQKVWRDKRADLARAEFRATNLESSYTQTQNNLYIYLFRRRLGMFTGTNLKSPINILSSLSPLERFTLCVRPGDCYYQKWKKNPKFWAITKTGTDGKSSNRVALVTARNSLTFCCVCGMRNHPNGTQMAK